MRRTPGQDNDEAKTVVADAWPGYEKIIVSGSKSFADYEMLNDLLDRLTRKFCRIVVLTGGATVGADLFAERWAFSWWWSVMRYHPDPRETVTGRRNANVEMVAYATRAVICDDGKSFESVDLVNKAKARGIPTRVIKF